MAQAWIAKKDYAKAIAKFNEAIRRDPQNACYNLWRRSARHATRDYDNAVADHSE